MPRSLPQNEDAERHVLGAALQSPAAADKALLILQPQHFFARRHERIFAVMRDLRAEDTTPDAVTVGRELERRHWLADLCGTPPAWEGGVEAGEAMGRAYLSELIGTTYSVTAVEKHAQIVREMWGKRRLIEVFTPPMSNVWNGARPDDVLRAVEEAVISARSEIEDEGESRVVSSFQAAQWLQDRVRNPPQAKEGIATPFSFLPRFQGGRLHVLGGYPKDGKTALMAQFVKEPMREGARIAVGTIEMSWEAMTTRIVSTYGVPYRELQKGIVAPPHQPAFERALEDLAKAKVDIVDDPALTAADVARYQRLGRYDYWIIDYLQRMPYNDRFELNAHIKSLTTLARKENIPILLLSQFSRPQGTVGFPRPTMNQFAETSLIEKEASLAMAIWRKRDENGDPGSEAELIILANRYDEPGRRFLAFRGNEQRFVEIA